MSNENFSWKSLFVNEVNEALPNKKEGSPDLPPVVETKFPDSVSAPMPTTSLNPYINEIVDVYEKGFNSLNLNDFDFFELYKSVMAVGVTNPQSYQMAFTMGKTIKSDLTKEFLIEKSKYYLTEIEKVYAKFDSTGKARKQELDNTISRDKVKLTQDISDLETKIAVLQRELNDMKMDLTNIDHSNTQQYSEIQMKLEANNYAKSRLVESINLVVSGINQYL